VRVQKSYLTPTNGKPSTALHPQRKQADSAAVKRFETPPGKQAQAASGVGRRGGRRRRPDPKEHLQYSSSKPLQEALRSRLQELAATHARYGYRPPTVLLPPGELDGERQAGLPALRPGEPMVRSVEPERSATGSGLLRSLPSVRISAGQPISSATS